MPKSGGGPVEFVTAEAAASEVKDAQSLSVWTGTSPLNHIYSIFLTWGRSEYTLMWFYLFLISSINSMTLQMPNLWEYTRANQANLGYMGDLS